MAEFTKVATIDEVPPGTSLQVSIEGQAIILYNVEGKIYACYFLCPHSNLIIYGAQPEVVDDNLVLTCPWHGSQYNLNTGDVLRPPASSALPTYEVQIEGNDIKVAWQPSGLRT
jgi:3-phenylpropionate/trans-cinnamate dioxygenase ferredoxin subunit